MDDGELVRLVAARCPELGELDLDRIAAALAGQTSGPSVPLDQVLETVEIIERRFRAMVEAVSAMMAEHERHAEAAANVRDTWAEFINAADQVHH